MVLVGREKKSRFKTLLFSCAQTLHYCSKQNFSFLVIIFIVYFRDQMAAREKIQHMFNSSK